MGKVKVIILGSNGFVGQNFMRIFKAENSLAVYGTSRAGNADALYFDILDKDSWKAIVDIAPDILIDASGYGVVKNQLSLDSLYSINYLQKREFLDFMFEHMPSLFWIQIGTAFEYSLDHERLTETSPCFPKTHYGISKLLFTNYLTQHLKNRFTIFRPFGMFGKGEHVSKFFPLLIEAQKQQKTIDLSDGNQARDYFYIDDFAIFILRLILKQELQKVEGETVNIGNGKPKTIKELSQIMAKYIPNYNPGLWNWGAIPQRQGENQIFYNASTRAHELGFSCTDLSEAFNNTVNYYYNL